MFKKMSLASYIQSVTLCVSLCNFIQCRLQTNWRRLSSFFPRF